MIRANKKIGIVYCGNSEQYVEEVENIIRDKKSEGYCIETVVVNDKLIGTERMIDRRVCNNLDNCDYGLVFLTKDLKIGDNKYVSRPNVLVELGYLRGRLKDDCVWCVTDFPYKEIQDQTYMLPSDFAAEVIEEIDKNNFRQRLKILVDKFIKAHAVMKLEHYDANDLVGSLLLNSHYKTDFEVLFYQDKLDIINRYSLKCQQIEIFKMWISEKEKLSEAEQIIYLFERMVFIPFFPEQVTQGKLMEFLSVKNIGESEYIYSCRKILKCISEYEESKRKRNQYGNAPFLLSKAKEIQQELNIFNSGKVAPIIECVSKNYIGLCYLNAFLLMAKSEKNITAEEQGGVNFLLIAKESFESVLQLSERNFSDRVEVFQAFACYNLARVLKNLNIEAEAKYEEAINKRKFLSETSSFPEIFKLNFALERIHAEVDFYDYMREIGAINPMVYKEQIDSLYDEIKEIRQTPAADVSLFETLENKLIRQKNNLKSVY